MEAEYKYFVQFLYIFVKAKDDNSLSFMIMETGNRQTSSVSDQPLVFLCLIFLSELGGCTSKFTTYTTQDTIYWNIRAICINIFISVLL